MGGAPVSTNPPERKKLVGQRLGRYDILYLLASGGMGSVYVGRQSGMAGFERLVAIKTLHPHLADEDQFVNMFLDEARLAARIRHPNVVATLDISESAMDGYFLVMEYVEGENLAALLKRSVTAGAQLPVTIGLRIVLDALQGLAAAHNLTDSDGKRLNLVHRDVSPQNVLVGGDGVARLTDFGIAKAEVNVSTTRHGQLKGKLSYMAPEQATHGKVEQRSDLFSMGIVLWEALTQKRLFRGKTNAETLHKVLISEAPPPSAVRRDLAPFDKVLAKALAKPIEDRFQSAQEMIEAIEAVAPQVGGIAPARAVSLLVQRLSKDKLAQESSAIRAALKDVARDGSVRVSIPVDIDEEGRTPVTDAPIPQADLTGLSHIGFNSGRRALQWGLAGVGLVVVVIAALLWIRGSNQPTAAPVAAPSVPSSTPSGTEVPSTREAAPLPPTTPSAGTTAPRPEKRPRATSAASTKADTPSTEPAVTQPKRVIRRAPKRKKEPAQEEVLTNPYR
jgi:serine/threonine protein kinase